MQFQAGNRRGVINRKTSSLPAFSMKGIRLDVLAVILSLLLLLTAGILFADVEAIRAGGDRIGKLSAGIVSLEGSNAVLQDEIALALSHPVLPGMNKPADAEETGETVILISAVPSP